MREEHDVALSGLTTMRVGGSAARVVTVESADELVDAVQEVDEADEPLLVLAGGSNLVVADEGFEGTVVRVATTGVTVESGHRCEEADVRVAAGESWDEVVIRAVAEGWSGIEALSGIPGSAGATPIQNVGAYGQEVGRVIAQVRVWDRADRRVRIMTNEDCGFRYRDSRLKAAEGPTGRHVVLDVLFRLRVSDLSEPVRYADLARQLDLPLGARVPLVQVRDAVLALRRRRGMVLDASDHDTWSCGSFFTNPVLSTADFGALEERAAARLGPGQGAPPRFAAGDGFAKTSAAWLIERAGFGGGHNLPGPAALSSKHPLALTNRGGATAADVVSLARTVRDAVEEAFGVRLVSEPVLVGLRL